MKLQILIFLLLVILILSICLIIFTSISQISGGSILKSGGSKKSGKESTAISILKSGGSKIEELEGLVNLILSEYSKKIEQLKKLKQNNELNYDKIKELNEDLKELEKYLQWLNKKYQSEIRYNNLVGKEIISSIDDVLEKEIVFGYETAHSETERILMNNEDFASKIIQLTDKHKGRSGSEYDREKIKSEINDYTTSIEDIHNKIQDFHNKWKDKINLDELGEEDNIHTKIQQYHKEWEQKQEDEDDESQNVLNLSPLGSKNN